MGTIVIVDDEAISRQILSAIVVSVKTGHEIRAFACPQEALDWVTKNPVVLVLTDYKMPKMNGTEFIKLFRNHPTGAQIPVIMVSADSDAATREVALTGGATDFLVKPVDHNECRELCRTLLA